MKYTLGGQVSAAKDPQVQYINDAVYLWNLRLECHQEINDGIKPSFKINPRPCPYCDCSITVTGGIGMINDGGRVGQPCFFATWLNLNRMDYIAMIKKKWTGTQKKESNVVIDEVEFLIFLSEKNDFLDLSAEKAVCVGLKFGIIYFAFIALH